MAPRPAGTAPAEAPPAPYTEVPSSSASTFTQNVIFNPCRGHAAGCCNNTFGTPEFVVVLSSASVTAAAVAAATGCNAAAGGPCDGTVILRADGSPKAYAQARSVERDLVIDADCSGAGSPFAACESPLLARQQSPLSAPCGNHNDSVVSGVPCRAPSDGSRVERCVEIAVTQTALIVDCEDRSEEGEGASDGGGGNGGAGAGAKGSSHASDCATMLEVHRPGSLAVLAAARLPALFTSGYQSLLLTTTYRRSESRVLCFDPGTGGAHELWWVHVSARGGGGARRAVARRLPFRIASPLCDWDAAHNAYFPYATLPGATRLVGVPPTFLFSRPRADSTPDGRPGRGMGATLLQRDASHFPPNATFSLGSWSAYLYQQSMMRVEYTVRLGFAQALEV